MITEFRRTDTAETRSESVAKAVELLSRGEVVALPTETVYGLAADATRASAVVKIFEAKERPLFDPLIVHLPGLEWLDRVADTHEPLVQRLVEKFWPGPLTLVLPKREIIPDLVTAGLPTVAVRMSAHPVFQDVIRSFGTPLAAPSANRFGRISPTTGGHVMSELHGRIPLIVDAGATSLGLESTIVSIENSRIRILRNGPLTPADLAEFGEVIAPGHKGNPIAPGQLESHYAPRTTLRIADCRLKIANCSSQRVGLLAWNPPLEPGRFAALELLSPNQDLREAARRLFAAMRRLDEAGLDLIVAEAVPEEGLGLAIMDRLRKAASK